MHIEFAAEAVARNEAQFEEGSKWRHRAVLETYCDENVILDLIETLGDEKARSIAATIRENKSFQHARVTSKQRRALASALLNEYETARAAFAAAYGVSEDEFLSYAE